MYSQRPLLLHMVNLIFCDNSWVLFSVQEPTHILRMLPVDHICTIIKQNTCFIQQYLNNVSLLSSFIYLLIHSIFYSFFPWRSWVPGIEIMSHLFQMAHFVDIKDKFMLLLFFFVIQTTNLTLDCLGSFLTDASVYVYVCVCFLHCKPPTIWKTEFSFSFQITLSNKDTMVRYWI